MTTQNSGDDMERKKFEDWYSKHYSTAISHMGRHDKSDEYFCRQTRAAWRAWQAALSSKQEEK